MPGEAPEGSSAPVASQGKRPIVIAIACVAVAILGLNTLSEGLFAVQASTDPFAASSAPEGSALSAATRAYARAIAGHAKVVLPLGIGEMILGALLAAVSVRALFGRLRGTAFTTELVIANAVVLGVGYALRAPVRAAFVDAVATQGGVTPPSGMSTEDLAEALRTQGTIILAVKLALQVALLGSAAFALRNPSVQRWVVTSDPSERNVP